MKRYLTTFLFLMFLIPAFAQPNGADRKKMNEEILKFKIDFLAKEMQLSDKEKSDFTLVYKECDAKLREATREARRAERELHKKQNPSESDYQKLSDLQRNAREKSSKIIAEYDEKYQKILSAKQIYTMHQAEEKFMKKMEEMRRDGRKPHGR